MYQSTDKLVSNEQGVARHGYQTVEGGGSAGGSESNVPDVPQTFLSQVKKAKEENVGCCNFCLAFFALLVGSLVWTIVVIVIVTVPIVMIVIGAEYFNDCPVQKMIPISLLVAGCVAFVSNVINFIDRFRRFSESGIPKRQTIIGWVNVFLNIFLAAWFVAMCYWVYSAPADFKTPTESDPNSNYCNPHLYGFVYWFLNFIFILFGSMVLISLIMMCLALVCW